MPVGQAVVVAGVQSQPLVEQPLHDVVIGREEDRRSPGFFHGRCRQPLAEQEIDIGGAAGPRRKVQSTIALQVDVPQIGAMFKE